MAKILLVEDDETAATIAFEWLSNERHIVEVVANGQEASERLRICQYDIILLDWELPGLPGFEVCRQFRLHGGLTPIIMVTGKSSTEGKVSCLDIGADDYITKPFNMAELAARIRARLRNASGTGSNVLSLNGMQLDPENFVFKKDGLEISLLPKEFALIEFFMRNPNKVFSSDALLSRVWHSDSESTDNALRGTLKRLRSKIDGEGESIIETVHGVGYRLRTN